VSSFRDLIAWQKAMDLAVEVYQLTGTLPEAERFGLQSQMRRAAVSIPSNIAEGNGRLTTKDWQRFLGQARGSANELETQILLSGRLRFVEEPVAERVLLQVEEVGRIVNGLLNSTRSRRSRKTLD
jgi:four helix bundle protein